MFNNTSAINRKVDELAATLQGLTISEDVRAAIAGIQDKRREVEVETIGAF
jgi:hypothetical protein